MALKNNLKHLDTFSMSSMTDVIFLLLIFFMVTSTLVFPAAIDVNLPQSSRQSTQKPYTEVYIDSTANIWVVADRNSDNPEFSTPISVNRDELRAMLMQMQQNDSLLSVALYADSTVAYARVVEMLDLAAKTDIKMVLATHSNQQ